MKLLMFCQLLGAVTLSQCFLSDDVNCTAVCIEPHLHDQHNAAHCGCNTHGHSLDHNSHTSTPNEPTTSVLNHHITTTTTARPSTSAPTSPPSSTPTTTNPTTTTTMTTTHKTTAQPTPLNVCDYLCSIQQGGAACDCSRPIVPGRKRSSRE